MIHCLKNPTLSTYTFCGQEICGKGKIWGFTREKQLPVKQIGNWTLQSLVPVLIIFFGLFGIPETTSNIIHYPQFTV